MKIDQYDKEMKKMKMKMKKISIAIMHIYMNCKLILNAC